MTYGLENHVPGPAWGGTSGASSLAETLERLATDHEHAVLLDDGHRRLSPFLLAIAVPRLARAILDTVPPGPVAVWMPDGTMTVVSALAVLAAGRECVVLDPAAPLPGPEGCAGVVHDPEAPGAATEEGCVRVDAFMACALTYAGTGPGLPDVQPRDTRIRFGGITAESWTLDSLAQAPHPDCATPVATGSPSSPHGLGATLGALLSGRPAALCRNDGTPVASL